MVKILSRNFHWNKKEEILWKFFDHSSEGNFKSKRASFVPCHLLHRQRRCHRCRQRRRQRSRCHCYSRRWSVLPILRGWKIWLESGWSTSSSFFILQSTQLWLPTKSAITLKIRKSVSMINNKRSVAVVTVSLATWLSRCTSMHGTRRKLHGKF